MSKIKETVTAVSAGNEPGAVRIKRQEHGNEHYRIMEAAIKCVTAMFVLAVIGAIVVYAEIWNLLAFFAFSLFSALAYFSTRD